MVPSKKQIEENTGHQIPDNVPISEVNSLPDPKDPLSEGIIFRLVGTTRTGKIIRIYLVLSGLGLVPKPVDLAIYSFDKFQTVSKDLYTYLETPKDQPEGYLVALPQEYQVPEHKRQMQIRDLPIGSGIYPVSRSFLG